jgi:beta-N-acetylhexosaminidase
MMKHLSILLLTVSTAVYATNFRLSDADRRWVEQTLRSMTVEEKIGQLLMPGGDGQFKNLESEAFEQVRRNIVEFHVGGYYTFGGDPGGAALMINEMQQLAKYPLLITADLEGGAGSDMQGATRLPLAMSIGATGDEQFAYLAGNIAAAEGRALGIHVNFYPVADVNTNPRNPIINIRSFGEDVDRVSALTSAYVRGA